MPDICKCANQECPMNYKCYRFTAHSSGEYQAWAKFEYKDGKCEDYWPVSVKEKE